MTLVDLGMEMFTSGPVEEWGFILKDQDFPTSVTTYCSFVMTTMPRNLDVAVLLTSVTYPLYSPMAAKMQ